MSGREGPLLGADEDFGFAWIFRFGPNGQGASIPPDAHFELNQPGEGFLWVHLDIGDKRAQSWLRGQPAIPETARYMFAHVGEHQHIEQSDSVIWGAIFDFVQDIGGATENVGHLRFALGERFLVSARRFPLQSADATRREIESGRRIDAPAALFETIVERVIDAMTIIVGRHIEALDDIEERALDEEIHDERKKLGPIRRSAARLRQLTGMRAIFQRFEARSPVDHSDAVRAAASRLIQRIDSLHQDLHSAQERARLLSEEMAAQIANNTNRSLSPLTGVTTLLLPPTFITGVFGMNVNGLPFTDDKFGSSARWRCAPYRRSRCMSQCAAWVFCGNAARRWHGNYLRPSKTTLPPQSLWIRRACVAADREV